MVIKVGSGKLSLITALSKLLSFLLNLAKELVPNLGLLVLTRFSPKSRRKRASTQVGV
ncbi:hypothetical protein RHMOL_Rhmol11G0115600 [Rhododendron molle]|uniref:Uncharacterized protein n=1 Tax=Rhododendron molle TaxID=49168 RepID=A0ACC0LSA0_RHOML|nr:hypothetical protein RHMOL_Rhmol11G0115600 [Rhododendron molle]